MGRTDTDTLSRHDALAAPATERDADLDDLLCRWHQWARPVKGRGFNTSALVVGDYQTSRQYDDMNGALDQDLEDFRIRQVDFEVSEMHDPHKAAIFVLARALTVGAWVFASPRVPADPIERAEVIRVARAILTARLIASGVI